MYYSFLQGTQLCMQLVGIVILFVACLQRSAAKSAKTFFWAAILHAIVVSLSLAMAYTGEAGLATLIVGMLEILVIMMCCERYGAKNRIVGREMAIAQLEERKEGARDLDDSPMG